MEDQRLAMEEGFEDDTLEISEERSLIQMKGNVVLEEHNTKQCDLSN